MSELAGTTRDTIEEVLNIDGILFRLIDTAGIREHSTDSIETIGIEKSFEKMRAADLVLYLFDQNEISLIELQEMISVFEKERIKFLLIANKSDAAEPASIGLLARCYDIIFISAKQGQGIDALKKALVNKAVHGHLNAEATIVTNARHHDALKQLAASLEGCCRWS